MPSSKEATHTDIEAMKALGEPSRCRIVTLLAERAYCVSALAMMLDISAPAVSQHLRVLRDCGIVYCEKYGYHTHYKLNKERIAEISAQIAELTREKTDICRNKGTKCEVADEVGCRTKTAKQK